MRHQRQAEEGRRKERQERIALHFSFLKQMFLKNIALVIDALSGKYVNEIALKKRAGPEIGPALFLCRFGEENHVLRVEFPRRLRSLGRDDINSTALRNHSKFNSLFLFL